MNVLKVCCLTLAHYNENCADEKFASLAGRNFVPQSNGVLLQNVWWE